MAQEGFSERACDRCRERRVKCDKRIPSCARCEKLGKDCPGYDKKRKFVDEGVTLRKKYQTHDRRESGEQPFSNNGTSFAGTPSAGRNFISPPNDFMSPAFPHLSTNHAQSSPAFTDQTLDSFAVNNTPQGNGAKTSSANIDPVLFPPNAGQTEYDAFDNLFDDPAIDPAWFNIEPDVFFGPLGHSCGFIPGAPNIVDEVDKNDVVQSTETSTATPMSFGGLSDNNLWAPEAQIHTSAIITDEREHEMAYLIRHFTEAIGPWMDLFDQDKHFSNLVPLKALRDALLRNAIAAVAAKQLGRVKGEKPYVGIQCQKPATMEVIHDVPVTDWFYKAANYYDKAIAFSRLYLQAISGSFSNPPSPNAQLTVSSANSDDLLVAVSMFSLYESLDNLEVSWLQHLAGFKTLLTTLSLDQQDTSSVPLTPVVTVGRRASFWNFARADYQAAYINHQHTFLNTTDLSLWRNSGLQLQSDGSLYTNPAAIKNDPTHCREIAETVSHTLLWLLLRVMNYLASDTDAIGPQQRRQEWDILTSQLDSWHTHLPATFQPVAQMRHSSRQNSSQLTEVFFTMPVCAASLHLYHFARILLLLHKPLTTSSSDNSPVLNALLASSAEALKHAHRIIGIALGRPPPAVRVEMLLPLFIAGVCVEDEEERGVVLELLRAIEVDTGCETGGRCEELKRRWEWGGEDEVAREGMVM
ncbi:uncharacterized protein LTR77_008512 [Saxophila tyrrhenica]|uniref:Zn(2)-C6 fungal-type domain-containing protein n=1 Tax=Saxophila tyrrhenica TaxID=1690608 RepID=A0AAV9P1J6_9PEZI|nr:hypothetical protein LTR77_008512 [Saxophila tyrrhenica]